MHLIKNGRLKLQLKWSGGASALSVNPLLQSSRSTAHTLSRWNSNIFFNVNHNLNIKGFFNSAKRCLTIFVNRKSKVLTLTNWERVVSNKDKHKFTYLLFSFEKPSSSCLLLVVMLVFLNSELQKIWAIRNIKHTYCTYDGVCQKGKGKDILLVFKSCKIVSNYKKYKLKNTILWFQQLPVKKESQRKPSIKRLFVTITNLEVNVFSRFTQNHWQEGEVTTYCLTMCAKVLLSKFINNLPAMTNHQLQLKSKNESAKS